MVRRRGPGGERRGGSAADLPRCDQRPLFRRRRSLGGVRHRRRQHGDRARGEAIGRGEDHLCRELRRRKCAAHGASRPDRSAERGGARRARQGGARSFQLDPQAPERANPYRHRRNDDHAFSGLSWTGRLRRGTGSWVRHDERASPRGGRRTRGSRSRRVGPSLAWSPNEPTSSSPVATSPWRFSNTGR